MRQEFRELAKNAKFLRHENAVAAGLTTITPAAGVDMQGFQTCTFLALFGTINTDDVTSIEVHQSADDGDTDPYAAVAGTNVVVAETESDKIAYVEVVRPRERFVKCIVNRGTAGASAGAALDGIVAILSGPRRAPTVHDAATVTGGEKHFDPAEGAA